MTKRFGILNRTRLCQLGAFVFHYYLMCTRTDRTRVTYCTVPSVLYVFSRIKFKYLLFVLRSYRRTRVQRCHLIYGNPFRLKPLKRLVQYTAHYTPCRPYTNSLHQHPRRVLNLSNSL